MRETLTVLDAPRSFGYVLADVTGAMRLLVAGVEGRWSISPEGHGTRGDLGLGRAPHRCGPARDARLQPDVDRLGGPGLRRDRDPARAVIATFGLGGGGC